MFLRRAAGLLFVAVYALPLLDPPSAVPQFPPLPDSTLLDRLFPGVPAAWIVIRLLCLALGAALLAWPSGGASLLQLRAPIAADPPPRRAALWLACLIAATTAFAAGFAASWQRPAQLAFAAALPLPPLLAWVGSRSHTQAGRKLLPIGVVAVLVAWLITVVPGSWRSPWIANIADNLGPLNMVTTANDPNFNFLVETIRPAQTGLFLLLEGGGWFGALGLDATVTRVALLNLGWLALTAILLAQLAARLFGASFAPLAAAFFLFSPSAQMMALLLGPLFVGPLLGAALLLCLDSIRRCASVPAFLAAACVLGFTATFPSMTPFAALGLCAWITLAYQRRMPWLAVATGGLSIVAWVLPGLPSMLHLADIVDFYAATSGQWSTLEAASFGWLDPERVRLQLLAGWSGPFDPLLASLALPFAMPRTAMRVLGDVLYDPMGTVLATVGMFACVFAQRLLPLCLLALLGLSLGGGLLPGYDRVSAMRLILLPLPMTLLACCGCAVLVRLLASADAQARLARLAALGVAGSGLWLGQIVQPRVLAQSSVGMAMEVQRANPRTPVLVLLPRGVDMSGGTVFLDQIPQAPVRWLAYDDASQLPGADDDAGYWLWSAGVEDRTGAQLNACNRGATIFELQDRSGLSTVFLARFHGTAELQLPAGMAARRVECDDPLETEKQRTWVAINRARTLPTSDAVDTLRRAARRSFTAFELYDALAHSLLARGSAADLTEAQSWAERAVHLCGACRQDLVATLAAVHRARGDEAAAIAVEGKGRAAIGFCRANFRPGHPCRDDERRQVRTTSSAENTPAPR